MKAKLDLLRTVVKLAHTHADFQRGRDAYGRALEIVGELETSLAWVRLDQIPPKWKDGRWLLFYVEWYKEGSEQARVYPPYTIARWIEGRPDWDDGWYGEPIPGFTSNDLDPTEYALPPDAMVRLLTPPGDTE